jgi:DNA-binding MarR family transcriptional regulator
MAQTKRFTRRNAAFWHLSVGLRREEVVASATTCPYNVRVMGQVRALASKRAKTQATHSDVARLKALVQSFANNFGLLVTKQTPCGLPISPSHAHCLMVLLQRDRDGLETSQSDLAERLGIDKSNVARLCGRLQSDGHATQVRAPDDGRGRIVSLTLKGRRMAERLELASDERFRQILKAIAPAAREPVLASLESLIEAVRVLDGEAE